MKGLHKLTWILVIIGGLNWLLVGLFNWDVGSIFGGQSALISKIVYILVGLSALVELFSSNKKCTCGASENKGASPMSSPNM